MIDVTVPLVILAATAGVLVAPLVMGLVLGVDRQVTAWMQLRVGPPVLQPLYDLTKLAAKLSAPADRLAAGLLALGLSKGDRVGIWSPNRRPAKVRSMRSAVSTWPSSSWRTKSLQRVTLLK